jgi:hypothetical protein
MHPGAKRLIKLLVFAPLALLALIYQAQSSGQTAQDQALALMQQQIGLDNAAQNEKNPHGLHIQFSKIEEANLPDGHSIRYRLLIPGAPEKQSYILAVWRIGVPVKYTPQQVYTNAKGLVMWHLPLPDQEGKDSLESADEIEVDLKAARGEPIRYMLASPDGKLFFPGTIVPFPIENKDGNCRLEARLGFPEGEALLVYVDGLAPGAAVPLQSVSQGETHTPNVIADERGHAVAIVAPTVASTNIGVVKISMAIRACSVSVEVPWGKGSYRPF